MTEASIVERVQRTILAPRRRRGIKGPLRAVPALVFFFVAIGKTVGCIPPAGHGASPGPAAQRTSRSGEDDYAQWRSVERDVLALAAVSAPAERGVRAFRLCLAATSLESRHPGKYPELTEFYRGPERNRNRPPIIVEACGAAFQHALACYRGQRQYWRECADDLDSSVAENESRLAACVYAVDDLKRAPRSRNSVRELFPSGLLDQARSLAFTVRSPIARQAQDVVASPASPRGADWSDEFLPSRAKDEGTATTRRTDDQPQRAVAPAGASSYGLDLLAVPPGAAEQPTTKLGRLLGEAQKPASDLATIFRLDVYRYFNLADQYDTDLKRKVFEKSGGYKEKLAQLKAEKERLRQVDYYLVLSNDLGNYDTRLGGFQVSVGWNLGVGTSEARAPKSADGIYFPSLPTKTVPFLNGAIPGVNSQELLLPMAEETALTVENNKGRVRAYLFFRLEDVQQVSFEYYSTSGDWFDIKQELPTATFVRVIVAHTDSGEVYYDKSFGKRR